MAIIIYKEKQTSNHSAQDPVKKEKVQMLPVRFILSRSLLAIFALFVFLISLALLSQSLRLLGGEQLQNIIAATSNPFIGLFIGLLTTAIIQKSSLTTSIVVAMVSADTLSLANAIPIIIGANIGTTITAMLVSFAHITKKKEFKRATSAAAAHNLFNLLTALIFFPLEYFTHFLSNFSVAITRQIKPLSSIFFDAGLRGFIDLTVNPAYEFLFSLFNSNIIFLLPLSLLLLFFSITVFTLSIKAILMGEAWVRLQNFIFGTPLRSLTWGTILTGAMQSSSLTTSVTVPLVATRKVSLKNAFPFIIGANIGTTFTALLASISQSDTALSIAITHLSFNVLGAIVFFPFPFIRMIPFRLAQVLGKLTMKNRIISLIYVLLVFFIIPFLLIFFNKLF
ncbi:Na/Pi symporter [Thermoflexibacter ruber]|uniref:Solute carrier family 34 (Sodium-dependent phosphate cotransporter) n=1 Tax=Thermoflexibacter ruber TaxID=1003 RepID=A0A1I2JX41_9BACT|nr:Na/Pi symporter [Thermoflexibacter ruber]SFF58759.1 solute carrier family 34 (sodium-dependent phosphate cotransporter) [Thermoflexibacter ruber]